MIQINTIHERRFGWLRYLGVRELIALLRDDDAIREQSRFIRKHDRRVRAAAL